MKQRLRYINPWDVGRVAAILYALLLLIFGVMIGVIQFCYDLQRDGHAGVFGAIFFIIIMLIITVIYAVLGFLLGAVFAAVYNLVAKWTGGLEFTTHGVASEGMPPILS